MWIGALPLGWVAPLVAVADMSPSPLWGGARGGPSLVIHLSLTPQSTRLAGPACRCTCDLPAPSPHPRPLPIKGRGALRLCLPLAIHVERSAMEALSQIGPGTIHIKWKML